MEYNDMNEGISPGRAGMLLALVVLAGAGIFAVGWMVDQKSGDPIYDLDHQEQQTSSRLQETQEVWKKKGPINSESAPVQSPERPRKAATGPSAP